MDTNFLFGISLTASFLAGVLALFAPCCITFLFPSYLGTIFKNGQVKVMFYTLIFALGLSSILIPIALGFRFFVFFLDDYHKQIYYLGAMILILMGVATLKPFFHLPQFFHVQPKLNKNINAASVFGLGLMSGLTSSCCAPVLFAAVTLTTLSPSILQAIIVALAYVLGIVFPLFILSTVYKKTSSKISGPNRQKVYNIFKILGAAIFISTGLLIGIFNYFDKIQPDQMEGYSVTIRLFIFEVAKRFQNPFFDLAVFLFIVFIFYKLIKKS
ncbi:MAG: sulfite exporter TauE/SafE family protein [Candidatus Roizmanbacteria bacterium]|nr:MAG: sulfite exporter TauE/SafE family protein [Candidatus Roizmanbacteria bacterium]